MLVTRKRGGGKADRSIKLAMGVGNMVGNANPGQ
jgi:hypothetical protein